MLEEAFHFPTDCGLKQERKQKKVEGCLKIEISVLRNVLLTVTF